MSFARRYAEQGDYEVSAAALGVVVAINDAYIKAKGKTFYDNPGFMENYGATIWMRGARQSG